MKGQHRDGANVKGGHRDKRRRKWPTVVAIAAPALALLSFALSGQQGAYGGLLFWSLIIAYVVPSLIAYWRSMPNRAQTCVINVLLGWTVLGWVVALVMAVGAKKD
jgi:Superinfection immunity protein